MRKVLVGGVFDILHLGHLWFLEQAKKHGDELVVVVARDSTSRKSKGRAPIIPEDQRVKMVAALRIVDKVVLGDNRNFLNTVKKIKPDVVVLGHDQKLEPEVDEYLRFKKIPVKKIRKSLNREVLKTSRILEKIRKE